MLAAIYVTYFYPHVMALAYLCFLFASDSPVKWRFFLRNLVPLFIAVLLAHADRLFHLWPAHLYFASGHMTFALSMALSLGLLRPSTLWVTLPLLIPYVAALVILHFHDLGDVIGAIVIVLGVYGSLERGWGLSLASVAAKPVLQPVRVVQGDN